MSAFDYGWLPSNIADSLKAHAENITRATKLTAWQIGKELHEAKKEIGKDKKFCEWYKSLGIKGDPYGYIAIYKTFSKEEFNELSNNKCFNKSMAVTLSRQLMPDDVRKDVIIRIKQGEEVDYNTLLTPTRKIVVSRGIKKSEFVQEIIERLESIKYQNNIEIQRLEIEIEQYDLMIQQARSECYDSL